MIFSNTDQIFEQASLDEISRKALLRKLKTNRSVLLWVFRVIVAVLISAAIYVFTQVAPMLRGDYDSMNSALPIRSDFAILLAGLAGVVGVFSILGAVDADHRVKMLILFDRLDQELRRGNQAEPGASRG